MRLSIVLFLISFVSGAVVKLESENAYLAFMDKDGREESIIDNKTIPAILARLGALEEGMKIVANQGETIANQGTTISKQEETIKQQGETISNQGTTIANQGTTIETLTKQITSLQSSTNHMCPPGTASPSGKYPGKCL